MDIRRLRRLNRAISAWIKRELIAQKHVLTGKILDIETRDKIDFDGVTLEGWMQNYARHLNNGVHPNNIPFGNYTGKKTSLYIEGLTKFAELRGMVNPLGAAFAIAHKQKKEGMPTFGSRMLAPNRTEFLDIVFDKHGDDIEEQVDRAVMDDIDLVINKEFSKWGTA